MPPRGFFHQSKLLATKAPVSLIPKCGSCGLSNACRSPKMEPSGKGRKKILIIGEFPSEEDDFQNKHFSSESGKYLSETLDKFGIKMRKDCILTNALICHPKTGARDPNRINYCRANLIKTIEQHKPHIIIPLGTNAIRSLMSWLYKGEDIGTTSRWTGWQIPSTKLNAWVCPNYSPAYVLAEEKHPVPKMLFERYLKAAVKLKGRPFAEGEVPDYKKRVQVILDHREAAKEIAQFAEEGIPIAFDYECSCLRPEYEGASILCCSVSNGRRTIAYPWLGKAIKATGRLLRTNLPKIASNLKMEDRWSRWAFGKPVRNWAWDTMVVAHLLDNRPNITSIKFQAFVLLGQEPYDSHIKPLLKATKGGLTNQAADEIDIHQMLVYCGLDSLLEWEVAKIQSEICKMPLMERQT